MDGSWFAGFSFFCNITVTSVLCFKLLKAPNDDQRAAYTVYLNVLTMKHDKITTKTVIIVMMMMIIIIAVL